LSTIPPEQPRDYADEAAVHDKQLDDKLAAIRRQTDAGEITLREAADLRVQALELHIAAIRVLRRQFFGDE
jgi:hypothetical protein